MAYLYILQCFNGQYYIGSTNSLERRMLEHNSGKTAYLKHLLPVKLVFSKEFDSLLEARKLELRIKRLKSRKIIQKIVNEGELKIKL